MNNQTGERYLAPADPAGFNQLRLDVNDFVRTAGHYLVMNAGETVEALAFNYRRTESDARHLGVEKLEQQLTEAGLPTVRLVDPVNEHFARTLQELNSGKQLWKLFALLALVFLIAEAMIIRWWK